MHAHGKLMDFALLEMLSWLKDNRVHQHFKNIYFWPMLLCISSNAFMDEKFAATHLKLSIISNWIIEMVCTFGGIIPAVKIECCWTVLDSFSDIIRIINIFGSWRHHSLYYQGFLTYFLRDHITSWFTQLQWLWFCGKYLKNSSGQQSLDYSWRKGLERQFWIIDDSLNLSIKGTLEK